MEDPSVIGKLIDKYGFQMGLLLYMLYRDHRFLRKLESVLDRLEARFTGKVSA